MEHRNFIEYFKILQMEWLTFNFRKEEYTEEKDLNFINRVLERKKAKIEDIATVNGYTSIFSSQEVRDELEEELFLNTKKFPSLQYKSEEDFCRFGNLDQFYWLKQGTQVKVEGVVGVIERAEFKLAPATVFVRIGDCVIEKDSINIERV